MKIENRLQGKVALVTGAAQNVGKGVTECLARSGATVIMMDRSEETLNNTAEEFKQEGLAVEPRVGDLADPESIRALFAHIAQTRNRLDILVNNAVIGPNRGERGPLLSMKFEGWHTFMSQNMDALFLLSQQAAFLMCQNRSGSIINISSNGAAQAHRQRNAYDALKGGLEAFTRAIAVDLAPWQVRVNVLRPCVISDQGVEEKPILQRLGNMIPMGRVAHPRDVGWAAAYLSDDRAGFITGQVLNIDGGMLVQSRPPELELEPVVGPRELPVEEHCPEALRLDRNK